jgi:cation transporter-like permease
VETDRYWEAVVQLIVYYLVFMIAGDLATYFLGLIVERQFGSHVSLIVFLVLYFLFLWISWLLAVWATEPKRAQPAGTA